jgi:hypothetical protein
MWHLNDRVIKKAIPLTIGDTQYPQQIFSRFSEAELNALGIYSMTIVNVEEVYGKKEIYTDDFETHTRTFTLVDIPNLVAKETNQREQAKSDIDVTAGNVRSYFAAYPLIDEEYSRAYGVAKEWLAEADPKPIAPLAVSSWADASGLTNTEAAESIITSGEQYNQVLDAVRAIRLGGKAAVDVCEGSTINETKQVYLDQLMSFIPSDIVTEEPVVPE